MMSVRSSSPALYFGVNIPKQFYPLSKEVKTGLEKHSLSSDIQDKIIERFFDWQQEEFIKSRTEPLTDSPLTKSALERFLEPPLKGLPGSFPVPKTEEENKLQVLVEFATWQRDHGKGRFNEFAQLNPDLPIPKDINTSVSSTSKSSKKDIEAYIVKHQLPETTKEAIAKKFFDWQKEKFVKAYQLEVSEVQTRKRHTPLGDKKVTDILNSKMSLKKSDMDYLFRFLTDPSMKESDGYVAPQANQFTIKSIPTHGKFQILSDFAAWQKRHEKEHAKAFIQESPNINMPWPGGSKKLKLTEDNVNDLLAWAKEKTDDWKTLIAPYRMIMPRPTWSPLIEIPKYMITQTLNASVGLFRLPGRFFRFVTRRNN